jgi:hypothetical protein
MAKLNTYVHVHDDDGRPQVFGPDDEVPDWAVKKITAEGVWAEEPKPKRGPGRPPKDSE